MNAGTAVSTVVLLAIGLACLAWIAVYWWNGVDLLLHRSANETRAMRVLVSVWSASFPAGLIALAGAPWWACIAVAVLIWGGLRMAMRFRGQSL